MLNVKKILTLLLIVCPVSLYSGSSIVRKSTAGIHLVHIPAGSFIMGSSSKGTDYTPPHKVTISRGFWIGECEITQKQYSDVTGINPCGKSRYGSGDSLPVYNISWYEAVEFCNRLSSANGLEPYYLIDKEHKDPDNISPYDEQKWKVDVNEKANGFRLPTEAQWECACRAGTKTAYYWGDSSSWGVSGRYSWHLFNSGVKKYSGGRFWWVKHHKVKRTGTKTANGYGLRDMSGNVAEWCFDRYSSGYPDGAARDPSGAAGEYLYRAARGGSILNSPDDLASYKRWPAGPYEKTGMNGLRIVLPE